MTAMLRNARRTASANENLRAQIERERADAEVIAGIRIREAREKMRVTLRELARTIGVSAPFMSDVEHGRRRLTAERVDAVAKALGMKAKDLESICGICPHCRGTGRRSS